jgi:hypothetical protein
MAARNTAAAAAAAVAGRASQRAGFGYARDIDSEVC